MITLGELNDFNCKGLGTKMETSLAALRVTRCA
jgi:hypothetical protein